MRSLIRRLVALVVARNYGIGWLFAGALIPGVLAVAALLYEIYHIQRDELEGEALQTSRALSHAVDRDISGIRGKLQILATSSYLQTGDLRSFYAQAEQVLATESLAGAIVLIDPTGQQIINTLRPIGAELPKTGHPDVVRRTFETAQPQVSDLYISGVARRYFVAVEVPVFRAGKVIYALDMGIPHDRLNGLLLTQNLPPGWVAALLDGQGVIVARSLNDALFVGRKATPDLREQMKKSVEGRIASHMLEGVPSFVAFSRSPLSGWTVAVAMTRNVLYANLFRVLALAVLSMLAFVAAGIALARLSTGYVRKSLRLLEAATAAVAAGDSSAVAPLTGPSEIVQLAAEFNRMLEARKKAEDEIARLAYYDPLTNLSNRRLLSDRIMQSLSHADRLQRCVAVCYLDLDGFKAINDTYGHDAGDCALLEVSRRLMAVTRSHDTVARLGGDEFVLLLADLNSREECDFVLLRVLDAIASPISLEGGHSAQISASIGVTLYPGDRRDPDILLRHSDQAMYQAKQAGRNRVLYFDPERVRGTP